jgi:L-ascorbate metabolism protein UlaG (beta-lactamase superfamily)
VFSPDGREVYWTVKFRGPILFMKQENGVWTAPEPAPFNSEYGDGEPIFSPDGKRLFFLSLRPIEPGGASDKENMWYVERAAKGWSEPKPVSPLINAFDLHWLVSVASSGTIYFASVREGGAGRNDIYSSRLVKGVYQEPKNLGSAINSIGIDHTPFIAPDESYLIYVSSGESTSPGDMKFQISYRSEGGTWMKPVALDQRINSVDFALCPAVTPDGKYMFFIGGGDIYWVDAGFIERLRPQKTPPAAARAEDTPGAEVTYIANEGFLIAIGEQKIVVDGLFYGETINWCHAPAPDTVELMRAAEGPFEGIDLILITHWHVDHFTPDLVLTHLSRNPDAVVVGSPQVVSRLRADPAWADEHEARIREVDLPLFGSKELSIGEIRLEAHRIRHGAYAIKDEQTGATRNKHEDVENLAYLVEAGGAKLMHFGDAFLRENQDYFDGKGFQKNRIDLVFLEGWSDETLAIIKDLMSPEAVIFMHMPPEPDRLEGIARHVSSKLPEAIVFREMMERRSFETQRTTTPD